MPSTIGSKTFSKSIELPETEVFRNLKNAKRFAMDIGEIAKLFNCCHLIVSTKLKLYYFAGGSLTKIAYYSTVPYRKVLYKKEQKSPAKEVYAYITSSYSCNIYIFLLLRDKKTIPSMKCPKVTGCILSSLKQSILRPALTSCSKI